MPETEGVFWPDFVDFLEALNQSRVDYILVGGYAVVLHGYSRTTGDLDIWVRQTEANYQRLNEAFKHFGLPTTAISLRNFLCTDTTDVFTFGEPPLAIDILTQVKGIDFQTSFETAETTSIGSIEIRFLGLSMLREAKRAAGRYKDKDDLENLPETNI